MRSNGTRYSGQLELPHFGFSGIIDGFPETLDELSLERTQRLCRQLRKQRLQMRQVGESATRIAQWDAAIRELQLRAQNLYYRVQGWPQMLLAQTEQREGVWYFLAYNVGDSQTCASFSIRKAAGKSQPVGLGSEAYAYRHVSCDHSRVDVSVGVLGFTSKEACAHYDGPAYGLFEWALSHNLLVKRVSVKAN